VNKVNVERLLFQLLSPHPSSPARYRRWHAGCVSVQGYHFISVACATTIISLKYASKLAVSETEGIQREGNRADLISFKYL